MYPARQQQILEILQREHRMSVKKLAGLCRVSEMTIRRDLKEMEARNTVQRYHGGAVYAEEDALPIRYRDRLNAPTKKALAESVRPYLRDGLSVFIDSSSTCAYILPLLAEYTDIQVVTNSVHNLLIAARYHCPCLLCGGEYQERDMCTVGEEVERMLAQVNIDVGFFSSLGLSEEGIISDAEPRENRVRKIALLHTDTKVFLFDRSKVGRKYLYTLCRTDEVDRVIVV